MDDHSQKTTDQEKKSVFSLAALELLSKYECSTERTKRKHLNNVSYYVPCYSSSGKKLSTVEIMNIAIANYSTQTSDKFLLLLKPFSFGLSTLFSDDAEDVELALFLLAAAEKVAKLEFDSARNFLAMCFQMASPSGNSVQRLVHCYAEALQERIIRQKGIVSSESKENNKKFVSALDKTIASACPTALAYRQKLPFVLIVESVGVQAILDSATSAKRIHLIALGIRGGVQWSSLMQALSVREEDHVEILKITVVSTKSKELIEETGRRLSSFAKTMNLPFSFNLLMLSQMNDLSKDFIDLDDNEIVVIHSDFNFMDTIAGIAHLESFMEVIKSLNPVIMVVYEVQGDSTSPDFMVRFIHSLSVHSAQFDSFEECLDQSGPSRLILEDLLRGSVFDTIAANQDDRTIWRMPLDARRVFFKRFRVVETELSMSSLFQAKLAVKSFSCASSCTLHNDGKALLIGWKGTPMFSVSSWKFSK